MTAEARVEVSPATARRARQRESAWRSRLRYAILNASVLAGFLLLWAAVAQAVSSAFVPGPVVVLQAFADVLIHGDVSRVYLHQHAGVSILRVLAGFAVASALAIQLGIALGLRYRTA